MSPKAITRGGFLALNLKIIFNNESKLSKESFKWSFINFLKVTYYYKGSTLNRFMSPKVLMNPR